MGGPSFTNPKYFWSPTGGWNNTPKNFKLNFVLLGAATFVFVGAALALESHFVFDKSKVHSEAVVGRWEAAARKKNGTVDVNTV